MSEEAENNTPDNHQKWWEQLRQGNQAALDNLYAYYFTPLFNYGMHLSGGRKALVEDCIQDFFVYLWHKRATLSPARNIKHYLFSGFRRRLFETSKKENGAHTLSSDFLMNIAVENGEPEQEEYQKLNNAVKYLSEQQKEALFLKFYNRLNYQEIANIMELKPDTAGKIVGRALKKLRTLMDNPSSGVVLFSSVLLTVFYLMGQIF